MKQYTTPEQTTKLIELGFEQPKSISSIKVTGDIITTAEDLIGEPSSVMGGKITANYSIGELIEMLQKEVYQIEDSCIPCDLNIHYDGGTWLIVYICERDGRFKTERLDLIDALYDMIIKLKEEGVI